MQNVGVLSTVFNVFIFVYISIFTFSESKASILPEYSDKIYSGNIKTVQMHLEGQELSHPVIELNSNERLLLSFDDLDADLKNYRYKIIHCNADWTPSNIFPVDYLDGFFENSIDIYRRSFNTFVPYTHYSLTLPNNDVEFKISGNYVIKVFKNFNENDVVLTRRFMVSATQADIDARVHRPDLTRFYQTGQQVSFRVIHPNLVINDPISEITVNVMQNGRRDICIKSLRPLFIRNREIVYEHEEHLTFDGLNEFRSFDIKNLRYQTEFIRKIEFSGQKYNIELHTDRSRQYNNYFAHYDINGRFLIRNEEGRNHNLDADYVLVNFTVEWPEPFESGNLYVTGALSDWNFLPENKMEYDYVSKSYKLSMLLKQGYYNYMYAYLGENRLLAEAAIAEGNYTETENDYLITVYHRSPGSRYDKLIAVKQVNSRNN